MIENKDIMLEKILSEIEEIDKLINTLDKESDEYFELLSKKDMLLLEYNILKDLNSYNVDKIKGINNIYIRNIGDIDLLLKLLCGYKKYYDSKEKYSIEKESDKDEINILSSYKNATSKEFSKIVNDLKLNRRYFDESKEKFLASIKNFDPLKYIHIKTKALNHTSIELDKLDDYLGWGADNLIFAIKEKINTTKKEEEKNKIMKYFTRELVTLIEDYIKKAYIINEHNLQLGLDCNQDFLDFYFKVRSILDKKSDYFEKIDDKSILVKYSILEQEDKLKETFMDVGIEFNTLEEKDKEDLLNIDYKELLNYIALMDLDRRLKTINKIL